MEEQNFNGWSCATALSMGGSDDLMPQEFICVCKLNYVRINGTCSKYPPESI